ncbi:MAG: hypothetical protein ACWA5U_08165 [bacterium]
MSYFKYLFAIVLVQLATAAIVMLAPADISGWEWLRLLIPLLIVAFAAAFWLQTFATHSTKQTISELKEQHAKEREKIRVNAERAKTRLVKKNQQEVVQEVLKTQSNVGMKNNVKMAGILTGTAMVGGFLLISNFMMMGLLALTTSGGMMGGYWMRLRQEKGKSLLPFQRSNALETSDPTSTNPTPKVINASSSK